MLQGGIYSARQTCPWDSGALQCTVELCDDQAMNPILPGLLAIALYLLATSLLRQGPELHDDQAFNAVACRHPEHGANLLRALRAIVQDNLGDAVDSFAVALSDDSSEVFTLYQGFVLLFLRETARRGFGDRLLATLTERGIADRHWPLQVAYDAYLHGENRLMDVNPEVRTAARRIYQRLEAPNRSDARLI